MICCKCCALPFQDGSSNWSLQHYSTFAALANSAQNGCHTCALFKKVLLEYYAHGSSCSVEEAELYQKQLDQKSKGKLLGLHDQDCDDQDAVCTVFYVKTLSSDIVTPSVPSPHGLHGLLYLRKNPSNPDPVDGIYPFVEVSSSSSRYS